MKPYDIYTVEGCASLPDFYVDPDTAELRLDRRAPRGKTFRRRYDAAVTAAIILCIYLVVVAYLLVSKL